MGLDTVNFDWPTVYQMRATLPDGTVWKRRDTGLGNPAMYSYPNGTKVLAAEKPDGSWHVVSYGRMWTQERKERQLTKLGVKTKHIDCEIVEIPAPKRRKYND